MNLEQINVKILKNHFPKAYEALNTYGESSFHSSFTKALEEGNYVKAKELIPELMTGNV